MAQVFDVQGFGALSEWNGQFSSASAQQAFQTMASLGSNSIELTVRIWTDSSRSTSVFAHPGKTESDASLIAGIRAAEAAGLSVVLKPAISALSGAGSSSLAPSDVGAFFASYTSEIVHLAEIAQEAGASMFVLGNEMSGLSGAAYRGYWTDMIAQVRQVFHGELTYAAATDEAAHVSFWDQLDVIGVNTYPPLTSSQTPTVQDLVHAWTEVPINPHFAEAFGYRSPVDFLHALSEQYGRPVLMTEVGYRSIDGTAINPGSWTASGTTDVAEQADAYRAFFEVWSAHGGSWMRGAEFWQWDLNNQYSATGYSPMGKPAQDILSQYFHGQGDIPNLTIAGSAIDDMIDVGRGSDTIRGGLGNDIIRGGAGNDVIIGGPDVMSRLTTTTVVLTGYGTIVDGAGAEVRVVVNGHTVSGLLEFTPASDPSGYQTYTVTFDNPDQVTSFDIELVNSAPGRYVRLKDVSVNGVALTPDQGVNASAPGSFDLYVRSIHFDTSGHQDWFFGAASDNDQLYGGPGNDIIRGGAGDDFIDGGDGIDTAVYAGNRADYDISVVANQIIVADHIANRDGTDRLVNVEFLRFADGDVDTAPLLGSRHAAGSPAFSQSANSDLAFRQTLAAESTKTTAAYDGGDGHLISFATTYVNGAVDQLTYDALGNASTQTVRHAADIKTLAQYDSPGHLAGETVSQQDGTYVQSGYAADGSPASQTGRHADGTRTVDTAPHDALDAVAYKVASAFDTNDGSYTKTADTPGVMLTSASGNDVMNSHGGDVFRFGPDSGHDTVNHVQPSRDVLQIASSVVADAAHLPVHIVGHDTIIDPGHDASITPAGVVTPLTAHDVLIV